MKIVSCTLLVCFLGAGVLPVFANGIDLVALKKKEEERRKKNAKSKLAVNDSNINTVSVAVKNTGLCSWNPTNRSPRNRPCLWPRRREGDVKPGNLIFGKNSRNELQERIAKLKEDIGREQLKI